MRAAKEPIQSRTKTKIAIAEMLDHLKAKKKQESNPGFEVLNKPIIAKAKMSAPLNITGKRAAMLLSPDTFR